MGGIFVCVCVCVCVCTVSNAKVFRCNNGENACVVVRATQSDGDGTAMYGLGCQRADLVLALLNLTSLTTNWEDSCTDEFFTNREGMTFGGNLMSLSLPRVFLKKNKINKIK